MKFISSKRGICYVPVVMPTIHRFYWGASLAILSMFLFSVTYALFKACSPYIPNTQIVFIQSFCSWLLLLPFVLRNGPSFLKTTLFWPIALRTIFGLLGMYCITAALKTTDLAKVVLLNNTAPLFVPLLLWLFKKEKISLFLACSILIGFIGVFLVLRPGFEEVHIGVLLATLSGLFSALLLVATKKIAHEPFFRILFYYYLIWWFLLSFWVVWRWESISLFLWWELFLSALSSIGAQVAFTASLRFAASQEISPFIYTSVIFSGGIGWLVWGETIGFVSFLGMAIVCLGGLLTMRAARLKQQ